MSLPLSRMALAVAMIAIGIVSIVYPRAAARATRCARR
jgi:hypothetical protein